MIKKLLFKIAAFSFSLFACFSESLCAGNSVFSLTDPAPSAEAFTLTLPDSSIPPAPALPSQVSLPEVIPNPSDPNVTYEEFSSFIVNMLKQICSIDYCLPTGKSSLKHLAYQFRTQLAEVEAQAENSPQAGDAASVVAQGIPSLDDDNNPARFIEDLSINQLNETQLKRLLMFCLQKRLVLRIKREMILHNHKFANYPSPEGGYSLDRITHQVSRAIKSDWDNMLSVRRKYSLIDERVKQKMDMILLTLKTESPYFNYFEEDDIAISRLFFLISNTRAEPNDWKYLQLNIDSPRHLPSE